MKWERMTWDAKFMAVATVFGSETSDCGADELLHLWEEIRARGLERAYFTELAISLGMIPEDYGYAPDQILQMMLASDEEYHWPAALKAAGRWAY